MKLGRMVRARRRPWERIFVCASATGTRQNCFVSPKNRKFGISFTPWVCRDAILPNDGGCKVYMDSHLK